VFQPVCLILKRADLASLQVPKGRFSLPAWLKGDLASLHGYKEGLTSLHGYKEGLTSLHGYKEV